MSQTRVQRVGQESVSLQALVPWCSSYNGLVGRIGMCTEEANYFRYYKRLGVIAKLATSYDIAAEQAILASLMQSPKFYWDLLDLLTPEVFTKEADKWKALALALETGQLPSVPADWLSAPDPHTTAQR